MNFNEFTRIIDTCSPKHKLLDTFQASFRVLMSPEVIFLGDKGFIGGSNLINTLELSVDSLHCLHDYSAAGLEFRFCKLRLDCEESHGIEDLRSELSNPQLVQCCEYCGTLRHAAVVPVLPQGVQHLSVE